MTPEQIQLADALVRCTILPGSYTKRFARDIAAKAHEPVPPPLSLNQQRFLLSASIRFRRQINNEPLIETARRLLAEVEQQIQQEEDEKNAAKLRRRTPRGSN